MGLLNPLYDAVSWIIVQFHRLLGPIFGTDSGAAWGLSIVGLVIIVRICLIPLFVKQIRAQRNLQQLQPQVKKLQERYKHDKERQRQELMKLYQDSGTNPFASCLPILLQAPFFFALYHVLNGIARDRAYGVLTQEQANSAADATVFGAPISDRFIGADTLNVQIVTVLMIVMMSLSQFITQRQLMIKNVSPDAANNPFMQQQKILLYVFPLIFAVAGVNFPVGVLLYWLTSNFWTMGQQFYVIRRMPTPGSVAHKQLEARRKKKAKPVVKPAAKQEIAAEGAATSPAAEADAATSEPGDGASKQRQQPSRKSRSKRKRSSGQQRDRKSVV